jgi:hypothetical protein
MRRGPRDWQRRHRLGVCVAVVVAAAGALGWVLVYSSVGIWQSLIVALMVAIAATAVIGALSRTGRIVEVLGFVPAFALLSWPPMWLIVVLVRYWLTGDTA